MPRQRSGHFAEGAGAVFAVVARVAVDAARARQVLGEEGIDRRVTRSIATDGHATNPVVSLPSERASRERPVALVALVGECSAKAMEAGGCPVYRVCDAGWLASLD